MAVGCPHTGRFGAALVSLLESHGAGWLLAKPPVGWPGVALILGETEARRGWEPPSRQPRALLEFGVSVFILVPPGLSPIPWDLLNVTAPQCHGP